MAPGPLHRRGEGPGGAAFSRSERGLHAGEGSGAPFGLAAAFGHAEGISPNPAPLDRTAKDWYDEAKTAFDQNDTGKSLALVQYAIRQDGRKAEFFVLQGQTLERMGDPRKALKSYEVALGLNPKDADTLIRMADIYAMEGMKARSEASLQAARRIAPNHRRFKAPRPSAEAKGKGKLPASEGSLADQAKALWGRLTGKG